MRAALLPRGSPASCVRTRAVPRRRLGVRSARARLGGAPVRCPRRNGGWARGARGLGRSQPALGRAGRGASRSGDEERVAHPAQEPAAAGRLHCLTTPGRPCPGSSGWRKSPALAPCSHCGPCLCLLFWNVLRVLIPVTVTCKSKRHIPLEENCVLRIKKEDWCATCVGIPRSKTRHT
ncbi:zinc finger protein 664 isoform X3 [Ictidomys tridecemlineatus]